MAKILVQREKKEFVPELAREVTVLRQREYFVADASKDFSTAQGTIKAKDLKAKEGAAVKTHLGKEFVIYTARFPDLFRRIRKLPQTITQKDIGLIVAETGIDRASVVVDAGAGSGALACFLAHLVKKVVTYEIREDFIENVKHNINMLGLKNITLKHADVTKGITEKNVDLVTLDLPEPWLAVGPAAKALKVGGFLVAYTPHVAQAAQFLKAARADKRLLVIKTVELIERPWVIDEQRSRPDNAGIGHTAFLTFVRRIA